MYDKTKDEIPVQQVVSKWLKESERDNNIRWASAASKIEIGLCTSNLRVANRKKDREREGAGKLRRG